MHIGVDKDNGLIHSIETTSANVHELTPAAELLHGEGTVVYADSGYQGIEKRDEMKGKALPLPVAWGPEDSRAGASRRLPGYKLRTHRLERLAPDGELPRLSESPHRG